MACGDVRGAVTCVRETAPNQRSINKAPSASRLTSSTSRGCFLERVDHKMKMTERLLQTRLFWKIRSSCVIAAPNYTPLNWWECDVWAVTKAGYAVEYEIKLSKSDFDADSRKVKRQYKSGLGVVERNKHQSIGAESGPSRFYYVIPESLESQIVLPEWAGLITCRPSGWTNMIRNRAPMLHKKKVGRREIRLAQTRMWQRYWDLLHENQHRMDCEQVGTVESE